MKKNWMQLATLCLCVVLLIVTFSQKRQIDDLRRELNEEFFDLTRDLDRLQDAMSRSMERELEKAGRITKEYSLEPQGIDAETKSLLADVSVTLKEWYADTAVTVIANLGKDTVELPMDTDGNGYFTARLSIPLEETGEIFLDTSIHSNGLIKKETLGGWGEVSMLLPLQFDGCGNSGPTYQDGVLSSEVSIGITGQNRLPDKIINPRFQTYVNGKLAQTAAAAVSPWMASDSGICYSVDNEAHLWSIDCQPGDNVEIHFLCEDKYGLGYEFSCVTWEVTGEVPENQAQAGASTMLGAQLLSLYWPE